MCIGLFISKIQKLKTVSSKMTAAHNFPSVHNNIPTNQDMERYIEMFAANHVDGRRLLELTDEDLRGFGIDNPIHRDFILGQRDLLLERPVEQEGN